MGFRREIIGGNAQARAGFFVLLLAMGCGATHPGGASGGAGAAGASGMSTGGAPAAGGHVSSGGSGGAGTTGITGKLGSGGMATLGGGDRMTGGAPMLTEGGAPEGGEPATQGGAPTGGQGGEITMRLPIAKSGQRLKMMGLVANGAEQFQFIQDQKLGVECLFVEDGTEGGLVCVPSTGYSVVYTDEACQEPALAFGQGTNPPRQMPKYVSDVSAGSLPCAGTFEPYRASFEVKEKISFTPDPQQLVVNRIINGRCQPSLFTAKTPPDSMYRLRRVPDEELVHAHREVTPFSKTLAVGRARAEDGAELTYGTLGLGDEPCALQLDGECVPEPVAHETTANTFLDDECTERASSIRYHGCGTPRYAVRPAPDGVHIFEVGPATKLYKKSAEFQSTTPLCKWGSGGSSVDLSLQREVTGTLPTFGKVVRTGRGPLFLQTSVWENASGSEAYVLAVHQLPQDFLLADGRTCTAREASDGTWRCAIATPGLSFTGSYADEKCEKPLFQSLESQRTDSSTHPTGLMNDAQGKLEAVYSFVPHTGDKLYTMLSGECDALGLSWVPYEVVQYWAAETRTDIADLPRLDLQPL
ncbi:MAG TPA: hypothetical protein VFQ61_38835 [Polyangiaceae bacterium]|nr:hypothetical protein [Polyangiaceae bacterium]